jgi:acyl transferase domain-containing protein
VGELFTRAVTQNDACRFGAFIDGIDQFDAA